MQGDEATAAPRPPDASWAGRPPAASAPRRPRCSPASSFGIQGWPLPTDCRKVFSDVFCFLATSGSVIASKTRLFRGQLSRPCLCPRPGPSAGLEGPPSPPTSNPLQLPFTSCPKKGKPEFPWNQRRLGRRASLPGGKEASGQLPPANTRASTTGHGHSRPVSFSAQTRTACSLDYCKLSIFDKMIPFVLGGSAFFFFFPFHF